MGPLKFGVGALGLFIVVFIGGLRPVQTRSAAEAVGQGENSAFEQLTN